MIVKQYRGRKVRELTGCIHNHTAYSFDCDVPLARVLDDARQAGLDYITINDHLNRAAAKDPVLTKVDNMVVMVGFELNDQWGNHHYLVFDTDEILYGMPPEEFVPRYKEMGATGFVAHPFEKRASRAFRRYLWKTESILPVDGVEIWNFASSWMGKLKPRFNGLLMAFFPGLFVRKPHRRNMAFWEKHHEHGLRVPAIGSADAHGTPWRKFGISLRLLPHRRLFNAVRTNVWLNPDEPVNQQTILHALKQGHSWVVNHKLGDQRDCHLAMVTPDGLTVLPGEEIPWQEGLIYRFDLTHHARVKLIHNGRMVARVEARQGSFAITEPGRWRLECRRWTYGWIYPNYIYVL